VGGGPRPPPAQGAIDARALAAMLKSASDSARAAVRRPVEGTMLTVVRELAEEARKRARKNPPLTELVPALLERAEQALARTPDELPALREAGVVDAGAAGLVELLRGIARELAGRPLEKTTPAAAPAASESKGAGFPARYCVVFAIEQKNIDATALERELEAIGDLLSLALGADKAQVHLHTDDPGAALRLGTGAGRLAGIAVARLEPGEREPGRLLSLIPPPR
jgi:dihydroxyacetone kinase-like predicted kinase